ncbi:MAG: hypothetical protein EU541_07890 [Promethearchaeota archaeon]|nr:MAG: hypothetical protein EU541_07890 [Candidatus Lokiarchaeota archaeon]
MKNYQIDQNKKNHFKFSLQNFKAFQKSQNIEIKPLTIISGLNNCGKSSILQSFLLLSQTLIESKDYKKIPSYELASFIPEEKKKYKTALLFEGSYTHLSHYGNIINKYAKSNEFSFKMNFKEDFQFEIAFFNPFTEKMIKAFVKSFKISNKDYNFLVKSKLDEELNIKSYNCTISEMSFKFFIHHCPLIYTSSLLSKLEDDFKEKILEKPLVIENLHVFFNNFIPNRLVVSRGDFFKTIKNIFEGFGIDFEKSTNYVDMIKEEMGFIYRMDKRREYNDFIECLTLFNFKEQNLIEDIFRNLRYIGPLREEPRRYYKFDEIREFNIGIKGEYAPQILTLYGDSKIPNFKIIKEVNGRIEFQPITIEKLKKNGDLEFENDKEYLDLNLGLSIWSKYSYIPKFSTRRIEQLLSKIMVESTDSNKYYSLQDVGFGISQIFPIFIESLRMDKGNILVLEQPEIHLHPNMQAKLADFLLSMAVSGKKFIIETHSEHLINRICLRIAQDFKNELNELISLNFVEQKSPEYTGARIEKIELNKYGEILNWPIGFLDMTDNRKILKAGIEKRQKERRSDKND